MKEYLYLKKTFKYIYILNQNEFQNKKYKEFLYEQDFRKSSCWSLSLHNVEIHLRQASNEKAYIKCSGMLKIILGRRYLLK